MIFLIYIYIFYKITYIFLININIIIDNNEHITIVLLKHKLKIIFIALYYIISK